MTAPALRMTAAQALIRFLVQQETERDGQRTRLIAGIFGIFGHGNVTGLGQAIQANAAELRYYQARNEQSMVHATLAYARRRRRLATFACTSSIGPGATNMITGAATATIDRLPVLLIPGDVYVSRRQGNVLQELEHPSERDVSVNDCFRPVSRYFDRISRPEQLIASLPEAMRVLTDPAETGAVTIALPQDVGPEEGWFPERFFERRVWRVERRPPDTAAVQAAVSLLASAKRPLLIAGGGVQYSDASAELLELASVFGIPVAETFAGKGAVRESAPILVGGLGVEGTAAANELAAAADLVICVGTRLGDFVTASRSLFQDPDVRFVSINIVGHDAIKLGALPVAGDAREALRALLAEGRRRGVRPQADHLARVAAAKERWEGVLSEHFASLDCPEPTQGQVIRALNAEAQAGDVVVAASGAPPGDLLKLWDATGGRDCQIEFGYSCMGNEVPGAIGARLARPDGEVFCYVGDGAYLINAAEVLTAVQERLKLTVVLVDNRGFQVIKRLQLARLGVPFGNELRHRGATGRSLDGPYVDVDLAKNAESLGARTWSVRSIADLTAALRQARASAGPSVIVVAVAKDRYLPPSGVWWDVAPPAVSAEPETQRLRAEYEEGRKAQRYYG